MSWLLVIAALFFLWLAYDAWKMAAPAKDVPFSVTAKALGQSVDGLSMKEQERRRVWNSRYGLGDLSQIVWLWGILALMCVLGACVAFFS